MTSPNGSGTTTCWTYDDAVNILKREVYPYGQDSDPSARISEVDYTYSDSDWGDLLTSYNGVPIAYDGIGNPLNDGTWTYTWQHGRQLASMTQVGTSVEWQFTYNADGLRTQRTNGTTTYNYTYLGGQLTHMTVDGHTMYFTYDASGVPLAMVYDGLKFYYITNLQGDVIAIVNGNGQEFVRYTYDAWGNVTKVEGSATNLRYYNPLRYRGYVYDEETKLYYLQSRYYNPEMGRFINGDNQMSGVGGDALGYNMFAYCFNNPVNMSDSSGNWPKWVETAANWVNKNIIQPATGFVEKTIDYLTPPSKEDHYNRNQNNIQFPEEYDETFFKEWDDGVSANCHQFTAPNRDNVKYVSPDGKYEAIYDVNNKLVTDPRDVGTYNFVSPNEDPLGHFIKDVIPWIQFGNSPDDSTEWRQRALSFISIYE